MPATQYTVYLVTPAGSYTVQYMTIVQSATQDSWVALLEMPVVQSATQDSWVALRDMPIVQSATHDSW